MKHQSSRLQNMVSILVTALLVVQTLLLILVLLNLKVIRQTTAAGAIPQSDPAASLIGTQAPDFTLPDEEGQLVALSEYKGHRVLLVFTSHTCPFCREMYPGLRQFLGDSPDIQVMVLSINTASENQKFREEFDLTGYANLHVLSATREVFEKYLIRGTPTFVVVDVDGKFLNTGYAITAEQISGLSGNNQVTEKGDKNDPPSVCAFKYFSTACCVVSAGKHIDCRTNSSSICKPG